MKRFKEKLAGRVAASAAAAFFVFLLLLVVLELSLPACLIIGGLVYPVMLLVLKPVKKIGKTEISFLEDGDLLHQKLKEAEEDYKRLCRAVDGIEEPKLREKGRKLIRVAGNILQYLTDNPKKIESAYRYIDYYQETAANILEHYIKLQEADLETEGAAELARKTGEGMTVMCHGFEKQYEKLMQNEMLSMEVDLDLLKQALISEGFGEDEFGMKRGETE